MPRQRSKELGKEMKVLPLFYMDSLNDDAIEQHSCSDRLWLPQAEFERYMMDADAGAVVTLRLKNSVEQVAVGAVFAAHFREADVVYAPPWMYDALFLDTDDVTVERFFPLLGTSITILPHTSDYLAMGDDPQETLKEGFEQYTCLTIGNDYKIWLGGYSFTITLQDITPADTGTICIRNRELGLHILPPLDAPWPTPPVATEHTVPFVEPSTAPTETPEERRRLVAEAARRRLGLSPN